jgi:hypothetical protein
VILRGILFAVGLVALAGSIALDRPELFAITLPCALAALVVGAGAVAADAIPLRRVALACSIGTILLALALLGRVEAQAPLAAGIAVLQVVAWLARPAERRRASPTGRSPWRSSGSGRSAAPGRRGSGR